ncbi:amidase signature domain-containing protein [Ilyonectria destructans]|nr:amidase signature domain-containing protein [Ilyonectria destructans]
MVYDPFASLSLLNCPPSRCKYWYFVPAYIKPQAANNLLVATAAELRRLLDAGDCTSVELANLYFKQIAAHGRDGMKLHAMISTAPRNIALAEARTLDQERRELGSRTRLHGIPIILKGLNATKDATMATLLTKAGRIVIGKSNMSEWSNAKGFGAKSGWSPVRGQTQSPYVRGDVDPKDRWLGHSTPVGSSSGSAVAVAAGFAPISIGTEADDSTFGTQSGGATWDSAGPLAKSVEGCANVMEVLLPGRDFHSSFGSSWQGIRIALLNYEQWQFDEEEYIKIPVFDQEHKRDISPAMKTIKGLGGKVVYDAPLMMLDNVVKKYTTAEMGTISCSFVFRRDIALFDNPQMRALDDVVDVVDVVEFNRRHADVELPPEQPSQTVLESGLRDNITDEEYHRSLGHFRRNVRETVEKLWAETGTDVIIASGESGLTTTAAAAGYPIASVPVGFSTYNRRPYDLEIVARNGAENQLFQVMSAWEATFADPRRPPPLLEKWTSHM